MFELSEGVTITILSMLGGLITAMVVPWIKAKLAKPKDSALIDQLEALTDKDGALTIQAMTAATKELAHQVQELLDRVRGLDAEVICLKASLAKAQGKIRNQRVRITDLQDLTDSLDAMVQRAREVIRKLVQALARLGVVPDFFIPLDLQTPVKKPIKGDGD